MGLDLLLAKDPEAASKEHLEKCLHTFGKVCGAMEKYLPGTFGSG